MDAEKKTIEVSFGNCGLGVTAPPLLTRVVKQDGPIMGARKVKALDAFLVLFSLMAYVIDTVTDILVSVQYFRADQLIWGVLTLTFVLVPSLIIQIFSGRWYAADGKAHSARFWLIHIFQLQPLERYLLALVASMEARRSGDPQTVEDYFYQQNDVSMLRLFEAFLESAPQLTLQFYVMVCTQHASWLTATSACTSLLALGWAVAAYSHALRKAYRHSYRAYWPGLLLQTVWHIGVVAARVMALVMFASVWGVWVVLVLGVHWLLMTIWVVLQNTDFCPSRLEEFLFDCIVAVVYSFSFFNLKEGRSRWRVAAFYSLALLENTALLAAWYPFREHDAWYNTLVLASATFCFFVGVTCMVLYYRFCHPSGPIRWKRPLPEECDAHEQDSVLSKPVTHRLPNCQSTPAIRHTQAVGELGLTRAARKSHSAGQLLGRPHSMSQLLGRRAGLLKPQTSCRLPIQYKEVSTPSQLSPIKSCTPETLRRAGVGEGVERGRGDTFVEGSSILPLGLEGASDYHHYSVDASACLRPSQCATLTASGVDLSRFSLLHSGGSDWEEEEEEGGGGPRLPDSPYDDSVAPGEMDTLESWEEVGEAGGLESCDSYMYYPGEVEDKESPAGQSDSGHFTETSPGSSDASRDTSGGTVCDGSYLALGRQAWSPGTGLHTASEA